MTDSKKKSRRGVLQKRISSSHREQGEVRDLIASIAREVDLPYPVVREAVFSVYSCLKFWVDRIDTKDINTYFEFYIKFLGTFAMNKRYVRDSRRAQGIHTDPE